MHQIYDYKQFAILLVDDEVKTCKYFDKAFSNEFRIFTASDVDEALQILDEKADQIGVLITDQRMPGKNGVELLRQIRTSNPHIVRMLTTAYSDLDIAIDAVNHGEIIRYITKPWNIKDLRGELLHAMEFFLVQRQRDLLQREKLSIWQKLIQVNLAKDLHVMGSGFSNIRYPLHAINAFVEQNPFMMKNSQLPKPADLHNFDLWDFVQNETQKIIDLASHINDVFNPKKKPVNELQNTNINDLLNEVHDAITKNISFAIELNSDQNITLIKSNKDLLFHLFEILILLNINSHDIENKVIISTKHHDLENGSSGVTITISNVGHQQPINDELINNQLSLNEMTGLLTAFMICYHHSGKIVIKRNSVSGLGFTIQLPVDPPVTLLPDLDNDWLSNIFSHYENIED